MKGDSQVTMRGDRFFYLCFVSMQSQPAPITSLTSSQQCSSRVKAALARQIVVSKLRGHQQLESNQWHAVFSGVQVGDQRNRIHKCLRQVERPARQWCPSYAGINSWRQASGTQCSAVSKLGLLQRPVNQHSEVVQIIQWEAICGLLVSGVTGHQKTRESQRHTRGHQNTLVVF